MSNDITSRICYLDRAERFLKEKPFSWSAELNCLPGLPNSNHIFTPQPVKIHDVRRRNPASLGTEGFTFVKWPTSLKPEDFDDESLIEANYYAEVEDLLWTQLPDITGIAILGHQVRKRSAKFPVHEGALVPTAQPQTLAHADLTSQGAWERLQPYFKDDPALEKRPWEALNVWRVLRGPSNDWPLALCDYRSIDLERDIINNDIVVAHSNGSVENSLLHFNERHNWFYQSDMDVDDIIVFRQTDSSGSMPRAWHASFEHPSTKTGPFGPRESIEVRLVVWK